MRTILFGGDGSVEARQAEDYVLSRAQADGAAIVALHVVDTDLMHYAMVDHLATQSDKEEFLRYVRIQGERESMVRFGPFAEKARGRGIEIRLVVRWGEPLRELLAAAGEIGADEIVLPPQVWGMDFTAARLAERMNRSAPCAITIPS